MLRGFTTISFWAGDLAAARAWYAELLGMEPYYVRDGYIEFRIGDYQHELGIIDRRYQPAGSAEVPGGAVMYWHVDDLAAALERLLELGAAPHLPITEHAPGFVTASVIDPFGNILGIMFNAHYLEMLAAGGR